MVEPFANSLTPDNRGSPGLNAILNRNEVSISYETRISGIISLVVKCSVCHHTLDVMYARGQGFAGSDLLLIEPHICPGKILSPEKATAWDLKHRLIYQDPAYCPATIKATKKVLGKVH